MIIEMIDHSIRKPLRVTENWFGFYVTSSRFMLSFWLILTIIISALRALLRSFERTIIIVQKKLWRIFTNVQLQKTCFY